MSATVYRRHSVTGNLEPVASTHSTASDGHSRASQPIMVDDDGTYVIRVRGQHIHESRGRYRVTAAPLAQGRIEAGEQVDGDLPALRSTQDFEFTVNAGQHFAVHLFVPHEGSDRSMSATLFQRHPVTGELSLVTSTHSLSSDGLPRATAGIDVWETSTFVVRVVGQHAVWESTGRYALRIQPLKRRSVSIGEHVTGRLEAFGATRDYHLYLGEAHDHAVRALAPHEGGDVRGLTVWALPINESAGGWAVSHVAGVVRSDAANPVLLGRIQWSEGRPYVIRITGQGGDVAGQYEFMVR